MTTTDDRDRVRRDLLRLAGYTVYHYDKDYPDQCYYMLMTPDFDPYIFQDIARFGDEIRTRGYRAAERKTEDEAWADAPELTLDWLVSLLPDNAWVYVEKSQFGEEYAAAIGSGYLKRGKTPLIMPTAATRLDALALAVRDYLTRAGNG
jgi:hypothetical protein